MMNLKNKTFDAVAESRKWRAATSAVLAKMTPAERITFLNQRIADFPLTKSDARLRESIEA